MNNKTITLTSEEQNVLTEVLFNAKTNKKMQNDFSTIDRVIDKITDRITYVKKQSPHVLMSDSIESYPIYIGGKFKSEHGEFTIEDIKNMSIKINGRWHHKSEFEPAVITHEKPTKKGIFR